MSKKNPAIIVLAKSGDRNPLSERSTPALLGKHTRWIIAPITKLLRNL